MSSDCGKILVFQSRKILTTYWRYICPTKTICLTSSGFNTIQNKTSVTAVQGNESIWSYNHIPKCWAWWNLAVWKQERPSNSQHSFKDVNNMFLQKFMFATDKSKLHHYILHHIGGIQTCKSDALFTGPSIDSLNTILIPEHSHLWLC